MEESTEMDSRGSNDQSQLGSASPMGYQERQREVNKASIFRMVYAETSYALWIERNTRIFDQRYCNSDVLAREIAYICNVKSSS